jgi:hypothetical protein
MVENLCTTCNQIEMTVGHRIEAAGIDGFNSIHAMEIVAERELYHATWLDDFALQSTDELNTLDMNLL